SDAGFVRRSRAELHRDAGLRHARLDAAPRRAGRRQLGGASPTDERLLMRLIGFILVSVGIAGCDRVAADRTDPQLVARVHGVEKVIDRELLVQKALEAGLERDPQVKDSIDNARRQVLAQAYLDRAASAATQPGKDEVHAFYAENPALFAERRIYRMRELVVSAPAELVDVLRAQAARATDLDEVAAWLKARNARFSTATETQPAEQLPLAYLPHMARMKPGEIAVFAIPAGANVIQLVQAEDAPLRLEQAHGLIEQF